MSALDWKLRGQDRDILRGLAERVRRIADSPRNRVLRQLWQHHDENRGERPLILTETDGGLELVWPDFRLRCREKWARDQEYGLAQILCHVETIGDDWPVEPYVACGWTLSISDFGVPIHQTRPETQGTRGAFHIDAALTDLEAEFDRLKPRTYTMDRERSLAATAFLEEVYAGILGVRRRGNPWWSLGLTLIAIDLIGLEGLMLDMYDQPAALHRLMAFLRDDNLALLRWLEQEGLLTLNNENDYIGSGSRGYTRALPPPGRAPDQPVRSRDLWGLLESQETVGVGADQYAEFVFPYENAIAEQLGRVYYGCCEPVHVRWPVLERMANLKRVSVSPWCDEPFMATALGNRFGYSRKPNPSLISTAVFDEERIRQDLRTTMGLAKTHGCSLEIAMKDVHTLHGEPDRLTRWVNLARAVSREVYGQ